MPTEQRTAGFTLLETLVALVLIGAVMGTVFSLISTVLQGSRRDEERLRLAWIAENLMVRSGLDLVPPQSGQTRQGITWRIERQHFERLTTARQQGGAEDENTPATARPGEVSLPGDSAAGDTGRGTRRAGSEGDGTDASQAAAGAGADAADRPPAAIDLWQIRVTVQSGQETYALQTLRAEAVRERQ